MKKLLAAVFAAVIAFAFSSCGVREAEGELNAMDTFMSFRLYGSNADRALDDIEKLVTETDKKLSVTDKNSEIYKLNTDGKASLSADSLSVLSRSLGLCGELAPYLDITVYPAVTEWGFISGDFKIPDDIRLRELSSKVDFKNVRLDKNKAVLKNGARLDLGAVAKGFLADKSRELLEKNQIESALLNFGGTIFAYGHKPDGTSWKIGIADSENSADYFGYLSCADRITATSGGYERSFVGDDGKKYIHIIDPVTCRPADSGLSSVSIISRDGTAADALSTALYVMGAKKAIEYYKHSGLDFDFIMLCEDGALYISEPVADSFVLKDGYEAEIKIVDK